MRRLDLARLDGQRWAGLAGWGDWSICQSARSGRRVADAQLVSHGVFGNDRASSEQMVALLEATKRRIDRGGRVQRFRSHSGDGDLSRIDCSQIDRSQVDCSQSTALESIGFESTGFESIGLESIEVMTHRWAHDAARLLADPALKDGPFKPYPLSPSLSLSVLAQGWAAGERRPRSRPAQIQPTAGPAGAGWRL